ncbi:hypothetical protein CAPTEDRAFT_209551, partial [Capitella teleta]
CPQDVRRVDARAVRLKKVISINGEQVDAATLQDINIHDFSVFEQEQFITRKFMSTIRRKESKPAVCGRPCSDLQSRSSFKDVALNVMRADSVLKAMRHYTHRSDTEESETEDEESSSTPRGHTAERKSGAGGVSSQQIKITEIETTKYIHVRQNGTAVRVFRETSV